MLLSYKTLGIVIKFIFIMQCTRMTLFEHMAKIRCVYIVLALVNWNITSHVFLKKKKKKKSKSCLII